MILNLTQHSATKDQVDVGVVDIQQEHLATLKDALTFDSVPTQQEIFERAEYIAEMASMYDMAQLDDDAANIGCGVYPTQAMIGGAPFFMSALESSLKSRGIEPLYAFSVRESVEITGDDGSVVKNNVFRHAGFVRPHCDSEGE